jgi:predicted DNA-binding transcriptional regulator AlpA
VAPAITLPEALLKERELARILGLSLTSLRRWRLIGRGPRYLKLGAAVRYQAKDVSAWLDSQARGGNR